MPIFITNFILPLALSILRSYLDNPSKKHDGQILNIVKNSIFYLSNSNTTNANKNDVSRIFSIEEFPQYSDVKGGL